MNRRFLVIRTLSGQTRYLIVRKLIADGPTSLSKIAKALAMTRSAIGHQLSILQARKILVSERRGSSVIYQVAKTPAGKMAKAIMRV